MNLNLVGIGTKGLKQITLEGLDALQKSNQILSFQVRDREMRNFSVKYGLVEPVFVDELYRNDCTDNDNYDRLMNRILSECGSHEIVSFLVQGHPLLGVTLSQRLKMSTGLNVRAIAAPSSLDNIWIDKWRDPLNRGTTVVDANRLLIFGQTLDPQFDTYIYHVCSVGNSKTSFNEPWKENQIGILKNHLLKFWPADHVVELIHSSSEGMANHTESEIRSTKIGEIEEETPFIHFGMTLFIPGVRPNKFDKEFLRSLKPDIDCVTKCAGVGR